MSIRARLSKIEIALTSARSSEMNITSDDLDHLTDDELDRLERIVVKVMELTRGDNIPLFAPCGDDVRAIVSWMADNEAEYLAAVRALVDDGGL